MLTMNAGEERTLKLVVKDAANNVLGIVLAAKWDILCSAGEVIGQVSPDSSALTLTGKVVPAKATVTAMVEGLPPATLDVLALGPAVKVEIVAA
jgi:hypothetical protein